MTLDIAVWNPDQHRQLACHDHHFFMVANDDGSLKLSPGTDGRPGQSALMEVQVGRDDQQLSVTNHGLGETHEVWSGQDLAPGSTLVFSHRCLLNWAGQYVELRVRERDTLEAYGVRAIYHERSQSGVIVPTTWSGRAPSSQTLTSWFQGLGELQRAAANCPEFYALAARSVVQPGGLDRGMIVLLSDGQLQIAASAQNDPGLGLTYRQPLVEQAMDGGQTLIRDAAQSVQVVDGESVVIAPVQGPKNRAVGAVYGVRSLRAGNQRSAIRPLEALWLQLVAEAVGAGMQRVAAESTAARTRLMFEQVFSVPLVDELLRNPDILRPQQREVSVLFCDLRDSTRLARLLHPDQMYQLLSEVLERLTCQVTESGGVILDYYGDGLAAMWNAPHDQKDHAVRACRAALNMISQVEELSRNYWPLIGRPLHLGIGVHTDLAYVGNAGSRQRLKYGPRGSMVTLASRLENVAKLIEPRIIISRNTRDRAKGHVEARFLCAARLRGIPEAVEIYELQAVGLKGHTQNTMSLPGNGHDIMDECAQEVRHDADVATRELAMLAEIREVAECSGLDQSGLTAGQPTRVVDLTRI